MMLRLSWFCAMVMVGNGRNQYTYTDHVGNVTALTRK